MTKLTERSPSEEVAAVRIKAAVVLHVEKKQWTVEECAAKLDLLPDGWVNFVEHHWRLETAWRAAEAMGLVVDFAVREEESKC